MKILRNCTHFIQSVLARKQYLTTCIALNSQMEINEFKIRFKILSYSLKIIELRNKILNKIKPFNIFKKIIGFKLQRN